VEKFGWQFRVRDKVIQTENNYDKEVVGACWSGYPDPGGNGYAAYCLPKNQIPEEGLKDFVDYVATTNGGHDRQQGTWLRPDDWPKQN
jgi:hypothetical protein